jgi:hypothetical protein
MGVANTARRSTTPFVPQGVSGPGIPDRKSLNRHAICGFPEKHTPSLLNAFQGTAAVLKRIAKKSAKIRKGGAFVEYLTLVTIVGLGVIVGLATVRASLINELNDLATAINNING